MIYEKKQLFWLEDMDPNYWVKFVVQPVGINQPHALKPLLEKNIQIKDIKQQTSLYPNENIWRSWCVYKDEKELEEIGIVPIIFDIDDESNPANIVLAYKLTKKCIEILQSWHSIVNSLNDIRVVFSGKKGFHIELKPLNPLNIQEFRRNLIRRCQETGLKHNSNVFFENTVIDTINLQEKPWVRVSNTIYSWLDDSGVLYQRKIIQISAKEFLESELESIIYKSQVINLRN